MKKLFTLLALAGFTVASANPSPLGMANGQQVATQKVAPTTIESFYNNVVANTVDKSNSTQATFVTVIPNVPQALFTFYNDGTQFQYDPGADVYSVYYNTYKITGQNISGAVISVYTSTNSGISWSNNPLYNQDGPFAIYGSFATVNPKKSKLFADWNLLGSNINFVLNSAQTFFEDKGRLFQIKTGSDIQNAVFETPNTNNSLKYGYPLYTQMMPYEKDGKSYVLAAGQSFRPATVATTEDLIKYCFYAFNFEDGEFTTSTFPSALTTSNFASPSPQQTADNYSSVLSMGYDEAGSIYIGVTNYLSDDNTLRVPAVTKTTDLGKTWSNISTMAMPTSLLTEYTRNNYAPNGTDAISTLISGPYDQNGFQVTGVNKFSYLIRLYSENTTKNMGYLNLIECIYDNGVWSLKTIHELASNPRVLALIQSTTSQFAGRTKYESNGQGNEVQLAKTADGKYLVAKWIDEDTTKGVDGDFTFVANNNQNVEQLFSIKRLNPTDVFMAYKDLASGNWTAAVNVTNDLTFQKATKMPNIVPSIDKVPIVFLENSFTTLPPADSAISKAPTWVRGMFADGYSHPQKLQFQKFNAGIASVKDDSPVANGQFQLNPVFPNPATGVSEITFSMNKPGMAKLALLNQVGQVLKVIYEGQVSEGLKAVTLNTDELASGVYYYTLTVGENTATKVLNVVK